MSELDEIRREIDEIDLALGRLFERRMAAAGRVAEYKSAHDLPVLDAGRETAVIEKNVARLENAGLAGYYEDFLQHLMGLSRQYQNLILGRGSVAYQGVEGGFTQQAAAILFPHAKAVSRHTFEDVFDAVQAGETYYGVVPFENSTTGDVSGILDLLYTHSCYICAMFDLPVSQNLLALPSAKLSDITTVMSHVQGLEQSKRFLKSLQVETLPYINTAAAAKHVAETGDVHLAAIASLDAGALYGLVPIARDISSEENNATRFIVITRQPPTEGDRFALLITVENKVGILAEVIESIAAHGYNMENIKSRPMPKRPWEYYFYIELVGAPGPEDAKALLDAIGKVGLSVRHLGTYFRTGPE